MQQIPLRKRWQNHKLAQGMNSAKHQHTSRLGGERDMRQWLWRSAHALLDQMQPCLCRNREADNEGHDTLTHPMQTEENDKEEGVV